MHAQNFKIASILLALVFFAAGCTAAYGSPSAPAAMPPAATSAVQPPATTGQTGAVNATAPAATAQTGAATQAVPQTGASSGGLVIAIDPQSSEARYRVREQLANVNLPSDAIGKTKSVSGSVTIKPDGTIDTSSSKFTVDLSTLQSDRSMRDNFLRRAVLQTDQFPTATFVPTKVSGLAWPLPQTGQVSFKLTGNLTIRDVTKEVTWDVTGNIQNGQTGQASGLAKTTFKFEDFNLQQPRVPVVLSIEDNIALEVDVALQPAGK